MVNLSVRLSFGFVAIVKVTKCRKGIYLKELGCNTLNKNDQECTRRTPEQNAREWNGMVQNRMAHFGVIPVHCSTFQCLAMLRLLQVPICILGWREAHNKAFKNHQTSFKSNAQTKTMQ